VAHAPEDKRDEGTEVKQTPHQVCEVPQLFNQVNILVLAGVSYCEGQSAAGNK